MPIALSLNRSLFAPSLRLYLESPFTPLQSYPNCTRTSLIALPSIQLRNLKSTNKTRLERRIRINNYTKCFSMEYFFFFRMFSNRWIFDTKTLQKRRFLKLLLFNLSPYITTSVKSILQSDSLTHAKGFLPETPLLLAFPSFCSMT